MESIDVSGTDLDSLAVTFGNSLLQSDLDKIDSNETDPENSSVDDIQIPKKTHEEPKAMDVHSSLVGPLSTPETNITSENGPISSQPIEYQTKAAKGKITKNKKKGGWNEYCSECNMWFPSLRALQNHRSRKHMVNCKHCQQRFGSMGDLERHECKVTADAQADTTSSINPTEVWGPAIADPLVAFYSTKNYCSQCSMWYTSDRPCKKHQEGKNFITCSNCEETFASSDELEKHKLVCPAIQEFTCTECGKMIVGTRLFNSHMTEHQYNDAESYKNRKFRCTICNVYFATLVSLSMHRKQKHYKPNEFQCTICNSYFALSVKARGHVKNVHKLSEWKKFVKEVNETNESSVSLLQDSLVEANEMAENDSENVKPAHSATMLNSEDVDYKCSEQKLVHVANESKVSRAEELNYQKEEDYQAVDMSVSGKSSVTSFVKILPKPDSHIGAVSTDDLDIGDQDPPSTRSTKGSHKEYVCQDCGKIYYKLSSFNTHRIGKHAYVCPKCHSRFSSKANYESHLELVCGSPKPQPMPHVPRMRSADLYHSSKQRTAKPTPILPKTRPSIDTSTISVAQIGSVLQKFTPTNTLPHLLVSNSIPAVPNNIPQFVAAGITTTPYLGTSVSPDLSSSIVSQQSLLNMQSTSLLSVAKPIINIPISPVFVHKSTSGQQQRVLPVHTIQTPSSLQSQVLADEIKSDTINRNAEQCEIGRTIDSFKGTTSNTKVSESSNNSCKVKEKLDSEKSVITENNTSKLLECHICHKRNFTQYESLSKHIRRHGKVPEEECTVCQKKFWQKAHLESHMNSHTQLKPFTCPLCSRKFAEKSTCRRHLRKMHDFTTDEARMQMEGIQPFYTDDNNGESDTNKTEDDSIASECKSDGDEFISEMDQGQTKNETSQLNDVKNINETNNFRGSNADTKHSEDAKQSDLEFSNESNKTDIVKNMPETGSPKQVKPFTCHLCGKSFVEKSTVRRHLRNMHSFTPEEAVVQMKDIKPDFSHAIEVGIEGSTLVQLDKKEQINSGKLVDGMQKLPEVDSVISEYIHDESISNFMMTAMEYEENKTNSENEMCNKPNMDKTMKTIDTGESFDNRRKHLESNTTESLVGSQENRLFDNVPNFQSPTQSPMSPSKQIICPICSRCYADKSTCRRHMRTIHKLTVDEAREKLRDYEESYSAGTCVPPETHISANIQLEITTTKQSNILPEDVQTTSTNQIEESYTFSTMKNKCNVAQCEISDMKPTVEGNFHSCLTSMHTNEQDVDTTIHPRDNRKENITPMINSFDNNAEENKNECSSLNVIKENKDTPIATNTHESESISDIQSFNQNVEIKIKSEPNDSKKLVEKDMEPASKGMDTDDSLTDVHCANSELIDYPAKVPSDQRLSSECPLCGKVLSDTSSRAKHMKRHSEHLKFKCIICNEIFAQVKQVVSHVKTHTDKGYRCSLCSLHFVDKHSVRRHQRRIHGLRCSTDELEGNIIPADGKIMGFDVDSDFSSYYIIVDLSRGTTVAGIDGYSRNLVGTTIDALLKSELDDQNLDVSDQKTSHSVLNKSVDSPLERKVFDTHTDSINNDQLQDPSKSDYRSNIDTTIRKSGLDIPPDAGIESNIKDDDNVYSATNSSPLKIKFKRKHSEENSNVEDYSVAHDKGITNSPDIIPRKKIKVEPNEYIAPVVAATQNVNVAENSEMYLECQRTDKAAEVGNSYNDNCSDTSENTIDLDYNAISLKENLEAGEHECKQIDQQGVDSSSVKSGKSMHHDVEDLDEELRKVFASIHVPQTMQANTTSLPPADLIQDDAEFSADEKDKLKNETNPTKRQRIKCFECNKLYASYKSYKGHRRLKHPLTCDTCHMKFADVLLLSAHVKVHTEAPRAERSYDCPVCGRQFRDGSSRAKHVRLHTGEKPYACEMCSKRFTQAGHLQSHMRKHNREKPFPCRLCGKYFTEKSSVKRHIRKMHYNLYNKKCDVCGTVSKTREEHQQHWRSHKLDSYKCEACCKEFPDSKRLKLHMYYIHTQREKMEFPGTFPTKYKCDVCSKELYTTKGLRNHMKFHINEKSQSVYKCGFCKKRVFLSLEKLQRHMAFHMQKGLVCVPCDKQFNNHSSYSTHKKRHIIDFIQSFEERHGVDFAELAKDGDLTTSGDVASGNIENRTFEGNNVEPIVNEAENIPIIKTEVNEADDNTENDVKVVIREVIEQTGLKIVITKTSANYVFGKSDSIFDKALNNTGDTDKQTDGESTIKNSLSETKTTCDDATKELQGDVTKERQGDASLSALQHSTLQPPYMKNISVYKCSLCKVFMASRSHLNNHVMATHQQKQFKCTQCSGRFSNPKLIKSHMARVHQFRAKHKCTFCDREFRDRHLLTNHIRGKHNGDYSHVCPVCGKGFVVRYKLLHHMEAHNSKHECPKCHTKFVHRKSYETHMRAKCIGHRKRRQFGQQLLKYGTGGWEEPTCSVCGERFQYREQLLVHLTEQHPGVAIEDALQGAASGHDVEPGTGHDAEPDTRNIAGNSDMATIE